MPQVTFTEKELEDYIAENCYELLGLKFIARQVKTPAGIIDILASCPISRVYCVIELKVDKLDPSSFVQVHKYTNYLNSTKSKSGKRSFIPVLIGANLDCALEKSVQRYTKDKLLTDFHKHITYYTLFGYSFDEAIEFNYYNIDQNRYQNDFLEDFENNHYQETIDNLLYEIYCLKEQVELI
jgi:hypothetical protein